MTSKRRIIVHTLVGMAYALAVAGLAGCQSPASEKADTCPLLRVVDGDTIRVLWRGVDESVRLLRINTPERRRPGYHEATEAMRRIVEGRKVRLEFEKPGKPARDRYGRLLAYVFLGEVNVNVEMVRLGHTRFWTKYGAGRYAATFRRAEAEARQHRRGIRADKIR